jgi:hypothetical protein
MKLFIPFAFLLGTAACGQEAASPTANTAEAPTPAKPAEVPLLEGSWRVTGVGGVPDAGTRGMTATFGGGTVTLATGCLRRAWTYTQSRNVVSFTASPSGSANCGGQAPGVAEETAYAALGAANMAVFMKDGQQASLSGTGGTVTLER